tara:strand:+ start:9305 stop:11248 length:1944 start_codon:yes stop_codon:yes gene_type:complete
LKNILLRRIYLISLIQSAQFIIPHESLSTSLWEPLTGIESKNIGKSMVIYSPLDTNSLINKPKLKWYKENTKKRDIKWFAISPDEDIDEKGLAINSNDIDLRQLSENNYYFKGPTSYEEAKSFYKLLKPKEKDYQKNINLANSLPTARILEEGEWIFNSYTISSFSGGESGGTGNQNYAFRADNGLNKNVQISTFYSIADDPLYAKIKKFNDQPENYWESIGGSLKFKLNDKENWNSAIELSIEAWNVSSGGPNIFNNSGKRVFSRNVISSVSIPVTWKKFKNVDLTFVPGLSILPNKQGKDWGGEGDFYGNNLYLGGGINWRTSKNLELITSAIYPFGPGNNTFNSEIEFDKVPILNFGIKWNLNPRISLEGMITNGFGATPATKILTIPSDNILLYYAGLKYYPWRIDTPQRPFTSREKSLALGGLTVNTALIPEEGVSLLSGNIDNKGNIFSSLSYSLSNIFQLDIFNVGSYKNVENKTGEEGEIVNEFTTNNGINTRFGGKFVFSSPLRGAPFWSSARISFGRNQQKDKFQGYLFSEFINTWEPYKWMALSINPKIAWSGVSSPYGIGLGANIQLTESFQLIPELNIVSQKNGSNNGTISLRWLFSENLNFDFYISSAAGFQDIGQLIGDEDMRVGTKFYAQY